MPGHILQAFPHGGFVTGRFHGPLLFTGGFDQLVKVWDCRTARCLAELPGHTGAVRCLSLDGGRLFSGSTDGTVRGWGLVSVGNGDSSK